MRPTAYRLPYSAHDTVIMPLGCVHWPYTHQPTFKRWLSEAQNLDAHVILVGDTFDFSRTHYRDWLRSYRADNSSQAWIDRAVQKEVNEFADALRPVRKRIMGVLRGNHFHEMSSGINSEQLLAQALEIPYLGDTAFVRLEFNNGRQTTHTMALHAHHGLRSCSTDGADVNDLLKAAGEWQADIHVLAHTHRLMDAKRIRREIGRRGDPRVIENEEVFLRTGTLDPGQPTDEALSANQPHIGSYAERRRYPALQPGYAKLRVILEAQRFGGKKVGGGSYRHKFEVTK